jgi:ABC-type nickel/cobalt efflux system permease component RcnA
MEKAVRNTIIIGSSIIVMGVATYVLISSIQRKRRKERNYQESGTSDFDTSTSDSADTYNPKTDAQFLKSKINGWGVFKDAYPEVRDLIMRLSDVRLIKLNNYYNTKGYKESGRSLVQELEHEDAYTIECGWGLCYANAIKRMQNLGLR